MGDADGDTAVDIGRGAGGGLGQACCQAAGYWGVGMLVDVDLLVTLMSSLGLWLVQ